MYRIFWILIALFAMASCSEDKGTNNPPATSTAILPVGIGNYWIYESYTLNANYSRTEKSKGIDSIIVSGTTQKLGKTAAVLTTFSSDSTGVFDKIKDDFYYNDKSRLYVHSDYLTSLFPSLVAGFIEFDENWLLIADENDNDWTVMEQKIDTVNLIFVKIFGNMLIRGKKSGEKQISVNNQNYTAQEYIIDGKFDGFAIIGDYTIPVDFSIKISLFFVKDIGLAGSITDMSEVISPIGTTPRQITESALIRFTIVK